MAALSSADDFPALLAYIGRERWVGRSREMAQASVLWQQASFGEGRFLLISGDPGVGKTRFVRELSTAAQSGGACVLTGECFTGGSTPYAPLADIIIEYFESPDPAAIDLPDEILTNLAALVPALRQRFPGRIPDPIPDPPTAQQRIFEGFLRLCSKLSANHPLLIFIDDAQWADHDTLSLVRSLARHIRKLPVLIVMTYREAELEAAPPLKDLLLDLNHERLVAHLSLAPFTRNETAELLETMFSREVPPEFLAGVYTETEGNPFFIEEVCKALIEEGHIAFRDGRWHYPAMEGIKIPQTVRAAIQARLGQLPEITRDLLLMAAILGREFDFQTLRHAAQLDDESLMLALESALRAQIILDVPLSNPGAAARFAFVHALIAATLRESIILMRRQRLHLRAALAIEAIRPDDYEALAYQFAAAGDLARACGYYRRAGERARLLAPAEAARFYDAALKHWPAEDPSGQAEINAQLGYCLWILGDIPGALKRYEEAYNGFDRLLNHIQSGDMQRMIGRLYWEGADRKQAVEHYQRAYAILEREPESPELARAISAISQMYMLAPENDQAIAWGQRALEIAERLGVEDVVVHTLNTIGTCYSESGGIDRGAPYLQESLRRSLAANLPLDACRAYYNLGALLQRECRYTSAREILLELQTYANRVYSKNQANLAIWRLMCIDWLTGKWGSALVYRSQLAAFNSSLYRTWVNRIFGMMDLDLGRIDAGLRTLEENLPGALSANDKQTTVPHLGQLARAYAMSGQDEKMIRTMHQVVDFVSGTTFSLDETFIPLLIACQQSARRSATGAAEAQACLDLLSQHGQIFQTDEAAAALAEGRGCLAEKSRPEAAADYFRSAAEVWEKIGRPYDQARALSSLSSALSARGEKQTARQVGNQALRLFNDLAAQLDQESQAVFLNTPDIQALRRQAALELRRPAGQNANDLSGREIEVLRLVAQGLTNAQIAERLVLSPLTVNAHLRSIFNKLEVVTRTAAVRVAIDRGWV
jgi:DNA-binding CsgD family transcriptional regulator